MLCLFQLVQTFHFHRWWLSPVATCVSGAYAHMYMDGAWITNSFLHNTVVANILWLCGCIYYKLPFSSEIIIHTYVYSVLAHYKGLSLSVHVTQKAASVCGWVNVPTIRMCRWATDKGDIKCLISNNSQVFSLHMYVHMYPQAGKPMYILTCITCNTGCHENTAAGRWYLCHVAVCHRALKPTTLHFDPVSKVNLGETGNGGKGDCM